MSRQRRRSVVGAGLGGLLSVVVAAGGPAHGSAAHLEVDGGVLQVFEFAGPGSQEGRFTECGDVDSYAGVVHGTAGDDVIHGGNHAQIIVGGGGDDVLYGGNQHDCLLGGAGDDELHGGNGKDVLVGGDGDDALDGGNGADILDGIPE